MPRRPPRSTLVPYTTLFRSLRQPQTGTGQESNLDAKNLSLGEAPVAVQDRIKADSEPSKVKGIQIHRKVREGKVVYQVEFEKRSEEHTSELQSQSNLVCRLL